MLKIGFSTCHAYPPFQEFLEWTTQRINHLDYDRFEVCHERNSGPLAQGSIDDFIEYPVLKKLNEHKMYKPEWAEGFRQVFGSLKEQGKEVVVWGHEIAAPDNVLNIDPELSTPHGDLDLSHPLLTEWMQTKYQTFFQSVPEVDGIVLVLTEVSFPAAHRFDNQWSKSECLHWLIKTLYETCREYDKTLIVRPFSAVEEDYEATREALTQLPDDIEIMLKTDPFDWDPFLPLNPALTEYPPERLTVEFDIGAEYFGRGLWPVIYPEYLKERIDYVQALGIGRIVGRLDRRGVSSLDREGRLNVDYFYHHARESIQDDRSFLVKQAENYYQSTDHGELIDYLALAFEVVKKSLYVDGQLLWHRLYGDLRQGQTAIVFDILRGDHDLSHGSDEWHILPERKSSSVEVAREEKREAVELAERIYRGIQAICPGETALIERVKNMLSIVRLYEKSVICMQEYILALENAAHVDLFKQALSDMREVAGELAGSREEEVRKISAVAMGNAADFEELLVEEMRILAEYPGIRADQKPKVIDVVTVGYPGEGHRIRKFTHGSRSEKQGGHCWRTIKSYLAYTLRSCDGEMVLQTRVKGSGRLTVSKGEEEISRVEWTHNDWQELIIPIRSDGGDLEFRVDRLGESAPCIDTVYALAK